MANEHSREGALGPAAKTLERFAIEEYGLGLDALLADPDRTEDERLVRIARLMGVIVKEPFAEPHAADPEHTQTGTRREWELDGRLLETPEAATNWQYAALAELGTESGQSSVKAFAEAAHYELGLFKFMARSLRDRICGEPNVARHVDAAVGEVRNNRFNLSVEQTLTSASAASLAGYIALAVPWLGGPASPLVAAVVLILATGGLSKFCDWTAEQESEATPALDR